MTSTMITTMMNTMTGTMITTMMNTMTITTITTIMNTMTITTITTMMNTKMDIMIKKENSLEISCSLIIRYWGQKVKHEKVAIYAVNQRISNV